MMTPAKKAVPKLADLGKDEENKEKEDITVDDSSNDEEIVDNNDEDSPKDEDSSKDVENKDDPFLRTRGVGVVDKTPNELAAETPDETARRYGIDTKISKEDAENPRVQVYNDTVVRQVPSGTHLHPDIARDLNNRGISENTTDSAQVKRTTTETYDFAGDAEYNDKF